METRTPNSTLTIHAAYWQSNHSVFVVCKDILPIKQWTNVQTENILIDIPLQLHFYSLLYFVLLHHIFHLSTFKSCNNCQFPILCFLGYLLVVLCFATAWELWAPSSGSYKKRKWISLASTSKSILESQENHINSILYHEKSPEIAS